MELGIVKSRKTSATSTWKPTDQRISYGKSTANHSYYCGFFNKQGKNKENKANKYASSQTCN